MADDVVNQAQGSKTALRLALVNSLAVLAAMGLLAYTRLIYKRPRITEQNERERLSALKAAPVATVHEFLNFDPVTANIAASPANPKPADGTSAQVAGKLHYLTVAFSLEIRDAAKKDEVEAIRPQLMDRFLTMVAKKAFHDLTSVQGRYILRTQLLDLANSLVAAGHGATAPGAAPTTAEPLIANVYFTQFVVQ